MTSRARKARIPAKAQKEIVISEDQWKSVEQAYGHSIPQEIRDHIIFVTKALNLVGTAERNAPALHRLVEKTKTLKNAAQSFLQEVGCEVKEDAGQTSFESLTAALATVVKESLNDHLQFMLVVHSTNSACDLMLRTWELDEGLREGWTWDAWVQSIGELMQDHGLPSAARKDSDKRDATKVNSQFVCLIRELQEHIPNELRRHISPDALAQAIYRARKSNWWPDLLPKKLTDDERAFIEAPEERVKRYKTFTDKLASDPNWIQRSPGSFISVEMARLIEQAEEKKTPKS
jgi:hypothetical protein